MTPYLNFPGTCEEAMTEYASLLGGSVAGIERYGGSPMEAHVPADFKDKVMHASITTPLGTLMGSDSSQPIVQGNRVSISISPRADVADRIFEGLSKGGTVNMPMQDVFWGGRFGMVTDRFGIDWMISVD